MSESYRTLENSTSELFEKLRDEKANFHISKKINLSNPLHLNNRIDMTADVAIVNQEIDVNVPQYEHVSPSECIDDAVESHADSFAIGDTCDIEDDAERKFADESTKTRKRKKVAHLIKRSCPKCKTLVADAKIKSKQLCTQCYSPLSYQCTLCDKRYNSYSSCFAHLNIKCNAENLDLKCPKCNYQTCSKQSMSRHKTYCSSRTIYSCSHCEFKTRDRSNLDLHMRIKHEATDGSTASCNREKPANLIKRSCPKCKTLVADAKIKSKQLCTRCDSPLSYQCTRCDKLYNAYTSCCYHVDAVCNAQNLDLKCPGCDYRTHAKSLMKLHLSYCLNGNKFSCNLCKYTTRFRSDLHRHMTNTHKDILKVDCSQCKTKPNKCEQCKKKMPICESCRTGFSSTDSCQEHQKSCKPPLLECKLCPYQTIGFSKLGKHIKLEHLNGSMPRDLPSKD